MPYIKKERRDRISVNRGRVDEMISLVDIENAGELNYAFTRLIIYFFNRNCRRNKNYQSINDIVGALVSAKDEFERRIVSKYEDAKMKINGDVYSDESL